MLSDTIAGYIMCYHSVTDGYTCNHRHPGWEILFVRSGEGVYQSGDLVIPVKGPSLVWIDSRFLHGPDMRGRYERWNVFAPLAKADAPGSPADFIRGLIRSGDGVWPFRQGAAVARVPAGYVSRLEELFASIRDELNGGAAYAHEILSLKLAEIGFLFRRFLYEGQNSELEGRGAAAQPLDPKLDAALCYIEGHLDQDLSVQTLSELLHYSRAQVFRLIRAATGVSLGEYVKMRRISQAQFLLRATRLTIKEIATRVGYPHAPHFCRVFREVANLTPTEYRQRFSTNMARGATGS